VPYNVAPDRIKLAPQAGEALRGLQSAGYRLVIITNQPGVAHGYFDEMALAVVERRLRGLLAQSSVTLAGFYYCPHHPDGTVPAYARGCACRKPAPGLILRAARRHDIDLAQSWFIGDILNDVEAGRRAGCRTILLDNGSETEWRLSPYRQPHHIAPHLMRAAAIILRAPRNSAPLSHQS
jgi:histidinol-phosphate phosphatase family protein